MITLVTTTELANLLMVSRSTVNRWVRDYGLPTAPSCSKRTYYYDIFEVYDWISPNNHNKQNKVRNKYMYRRRLHRYIFVTCFPEGGELYFKHSKLTKTHLEKLAA